MPIYEYKCTSCSFGFEERQGFDAEPICVCPKCQNEARRLFTPAPIIFKGKGFYVTDYPSASANGARSKSEEAPVTESKKETSAKSEPEAKAATSASADK
ncbi:MAG: zinc ribbon domain-containing protein [Dehalococcoidia bacterium]|nr:zinc ribbon domain-containing protein [Dehalococcoidia bacterium]